MADDKVIILSVETGQAVKNVGELRTNIKEYKKQLEGLNIDSEEYQKTLKNLNESQNALKGAMHATNTSMNEVASNAKGLNVVFDENNKLINKGNISYNALVNTMSELKGEWRATSDVVRRAELGKQIDQLNTQLKTLDAETGNFQRNVGNYQSVFKGFADKTDAFGKGLKAAKGGVDGLKNGFDGIAKSPAFGTFGLLVTLAFKLADSLKDNETAMESIKGAMNGLKPIMDFFSGVIETIATYLADIIGKVMEFVTSNGLIDKVIKGVMGVGNAIVQYVAAPFKGVIEAIKVFKEQGVKGLGDAARAFGNEMKQGFSFKQNFEAGETMAETMMSGAKSKKKEVEGVGKEVGDSFAKGLEKAVDETLKRLERRQDQMLKDQLDTDNLVEEWQEEFDAEMEAYFASMEEAEQRKQIMREYEEEQEKLHQEELARVAQTRIDTMFAVANATSDILGSIADMYEADEENAEKNAEKVKALRIAAATIDTISGAVGAFMQASATLPPPYGQIVGAITAASVTAAGIAQIAQMKNKSVKSANASISSPSAVTNAPQIDTEITGVRSLTTASEEDRLNQMASSQKVYILSSDIEASQNQRKVQVAESSF